MARLYGQVSAFQRLRVAVPWLSRGSIALSACQCSPMWLQPDCKLDRLGSIVAALHHCKHTR